MVELYTPLLSWFLLCFIIFFSGEFIISYFNRTKNTQISLNRGLQ